ncbi:MAG: hypothetical protein AB7K24_02620 [Gemmataceae bacterium]
MSEQTWLKSRDPGQMLTMLYRRGSMRKLRLFNVACCRRVEHALKVRDQALLELALLRADDQIDDDCLPREFSGKGPGPFAAFFAAEALDPYYNHWALLEKQCRSARACAENAIEALADFERAERGAERVAQANLLREIFGNPFRPVRVEPDWLNWRDRLVVNLARAAYDGCSRAGVLDPERLVILADALEEAGCSNHDMLGHLRGLGLCHLKGCWVIDLLLEKT